jgi:hypothetical protein
MSLNSKIIKEVMRLPSGPHLSTSKTIINSNIFYVGNEYDQIAIILFRLFLMYKLVDLEIIQISEYYLLLRSVCKLEFNVTFLLYCRCR